MEKASGYKCDNRVMLIANMYLSHCVTADTSLPASFNKNDAPWGLSSALDNLIGFSWVSWMLWRRNPVSLHLYPAMTAVHSLLHKHDFRSTDLGLTDSFLIICILIFVEKLANMLYKSQSMNYGKFLSSYFCTSVWTSPCPHICTIPHCSLS